MPAASRTRAIAVTVFAIASTLTSTAQQGSASNPFILQPYTLDRRLGLLLVRSSPRTPCAFRRLRERPHRPHLPSRPPRRPRSPKTDQVEKELRDVQQVKERGPGGHVLTGPIYVEEAETGDVLEVRFTAIDLAIPYGYNAIGQAGFLSDEIFDRKMRIINFDAKKMLGHFAEGIDIPLHPFFGSVGVAPPKEAGRWNSAPPWIHAGNLDNKELVAGTSLFIPVYVKGALLEIGDGHAAQGNGEVDITAIETSLIGHLQLVVHKGRSQRWPRAETPTHFISMGNRP